MLLLVYGFIAGWFLSSYLFCVWGWYAEKLTEARENLSLLSGAITYSILNKLKKK